MSSLLKFDIIIRNGSIFDGTGSRPFTADMGLAGDRIAAIGDLEQAVADQVLDINNLAVCPGFIDTHAHSEFTLLADPRAAAKILQGVTTEINGNCGLSGGPLLGAYAERREDDLKELGIRERWQSLEEYFSILERRSPALNFKTLVGHGNIRGAVVGYADRPATETELARMKSLLRTALFQGACGLSTGLIYPPGVYSDLDELADLASEVALSGGIYATHMRSESDDVVQAVSEALEIGARGSIPVHISHLKTAGRTNWNKIDKIFSLMSNSISKGHKVTCDRYPYVAGSTDLDALLPAWVYEGGAGAEMDRLRNDAVVERIRNEMGTEIMGDDYWKDVRVSSVSRDENIWMQGLDMLAVSRRLNKKPFDAYIEVLLDERLRAGGIFFGMSQENLKRILTKNYTMVGSDASARCFDGITASGHPHPRAFGTFPKFLGYYSRDLQLMPFAEAVRKITSLPAEVFRIQGRGRIYEGAYADLVIVDPGSVKDRATFEKPFLPSDGILHVFVNGLQVVKNGSLTEVRPGRILRGYTGNA